MALGLCSEPFDASPRISFSHEIIPVEQTPLHSGSPGLNQSFDFSSCGFDRSGWSPADELFSDGKMIPLLQIKKNVQEGDENVQGEDDFIRDPLPKEDRREGGEEKEVGTNCDNRNKSFWLFRRTSSLNSGGCGYGRMGLCPLPLLSRSNSTGSTPAPRKNKHSVSKQFHPQELHPGNNVLVSEASSEETPQRQQQRGRPGRDKGGFSPERGCVGKYVRSVLGFRPG